MSLDDFLDKFNWISRAHGLLWGLTTYLPHRATHKGRKVGPWQLDGGTRQISVDRYHTTGGQAERILQRAHIPIAGRRITSREALFLVKSRQAAWAEYNLLRAGAVLGPTHKIIDPRNVAWAGKFQTAVPVWANRGADPGPADPPRDEHPQRPEARQNGPQRGPRARRWLGDLW